MQLILFIGIQATGKSTYYKKYLFDTHLRINLDMLKTRHREAILFNSCLASKTKCVIDNTNPLISDRARYISSARLKKFKITGYYFLPDINRSLKWNKAREYPVPEKGIYSTFHKIEKPEMAEGFDELYYITIDNGNNFNTTKWNSQEL